MNSYFRDNARLDWPRAQWFSSIRTVKESANALKKRGCFFNIIPTSKDAKTDEQLSFPRR
jgi:hypothetical protein